MCIKMDNMLKCFMDNTSKEFHIRELARLAKKSPTTISKELLALKKQGLLESSRKLGHLFYKADMGNPAFKDLKIYYNIKAIRDSGLTEYLEKEFNHPEAIVLFGSFRKGEDIARSDIDILVLTSLKKEPDLSSYERKLKHEIQLFAVSRQKIKEMKQKNPELLNNVINGIVLYGFLELF